MVELANISWLLAILVVVAVAQRGLGPSSSATTSTTDRALPSSAVQARCWSRPTTTTRLPLLSDSAACSAWSRHTTTVKNDASCSRRPDTATRNTARAIPPSVCRSSGSSVRLPAKLMLGSVMVCPSWCLAGRSALPLEPGTVDAVACRESARGKRWSQRSRPWIRTAGRWPARVSGWLVECLRLGVGHASTVRPDPSTLGVVGERGSHREGRSPARPRRLLGRQE
jgi:hypothetical protein